MVKEERVKMTKELKLKMLQALKNGFAIKDNFKEFHPSQVVIFELPDNGRD